MKWSPFLAVLLAAGAADARPVRNTTRTSVNRNVNANRNVNRNVNVDRNVNRSVNYHRDIDVDIDRHHYHPVARTAGVVAATAVTAAAIGSVVNTLPPSCTTIVQVGVTYRAVRQYLVSAALRRHPGQLRGRKRALIGAFREARPSCPAAEFLESVSQQPSAKVSNVT